VYLSFERRKEKRERDRDREALFMTHLPPPDGQLGSVL